MEGYTTLITKINMLTSLLKEQNERINRLEEKVNHITSPDGPLTKDQLDDIAKMMMEKIDSLFVHEPTELEHILSLGQLYGDIKEKFGGLTTILQCDHQECIDLIKNWGPDITHR